MNGSWSPSATDTQKTVKKGKKKPLGLWKRRYSTEKYLSPKTLPTIKRGKQNVHHKRTESEHLEERKKMKNKTRAKAKTFVDNYHLAYKTMSDGEDEFSGKPVSH